MLLGITGIWGFYNNTQLQLDINCGLRPPSKPGEMVANENDVELKLCVVIIETRS